MIEHFVGIGRYARDNYPELNVTDMMLNYLRKEDFDNVLEININDGTIESLVKAFYEDVVKDALFFQKGNGFLGGGVRLDNYNEKKLKQACNFCEIDKAHHPKIQGIVENHISKYNSKAFLLLKVSNQTPRQLFEDKFLRSMYETTYKALKGEHICHLCSKKGQTYEKFGYTFYTNDKQIYSCVDGKDKWGIVLCQDCLTDILFARKYINEFLSTYWINTQVMFIPHFYDEEVARIYESSHIDENRAMKSLLNQIGTNEDDVIQEIGKSHSMTDIVFYSENPTNKSWTIYHTITSVLPSRFSKIAKLLKDYDLSFYSILQYIAAVKVKGNKMDTTRKENLRFLDAIFQGKKIDRNLFFKRVMDVYKMYYLADEHRKYAIMRRINRIYGFLVDCNCLVKGVKFMDYQNYDELFNQNPQYFDSNEKKAWFILGRVFDYINYNMRDRGKSEEGQSVSDKTSLEKKFFFARKFDYSDFIYFCNLLEDKAIKYNIASNYYKKMITEAKNYMANRTENLSHDEAKYLFFWGIDSYFKKADDTANNEDEEMEE